MVDPAACSVALVIRLAAAIVVATLPPLPKIAPLPALAHDGVEVVSERAVDRQPGSPAVGFGSVWVPSSADGIVDRVDAKTGKLLARIRSGTSRTTAQNEYFDSVAAGAGAVWHASDVGGTISKISPRTNKVVKRALVPGRPGAVAAASTGVYVSLFNQSTVLRLSPATLKVAKRADVGGPALGVAYGAGSVWVVTSNGPSVVRLDPVTLAVEKRISIVSSAPTGAGFASAWWISATSTAVCAGKYQQNVVTRVDPGTNAVAEQTALGFGAHPFGVAAADGSCWAANDTGVFHGPASSHLPPAGFVGIAADAGGAWVTSARRNTLFRVR